MTKFTWPKVALAGIGLVSASLVAQAQELAHSLPPRIAGSLAMIDVTSSCMPRRPEGVAGGDGVTLLLREGSREGFPALVVSPPPKSKDKRALDQAAAEAIGRCLEKFGDGVEGRTVTTWDLVAVVWTSDELARQVPVRLMAPPAGEGSSDSYCMRPLYLSDAVKHGLTGSLEVSFQLDDKGGINAFEVRSPGGSKPPEKFSDAMLLPITLALATCAFDPEREASGQAVSSVHRVVFKWQID